MSDPSPTNDAPAFAAGRSEPWTYESLAAVDRETLEQVILTGTAPDFSQTEGYIYCGWNHEWVSVLSGRKFKKGFRQKDGGWFGYNHIVIQDDNGYEGEWKLKMNDGDKPRHLGFFHVGQIADEPPEKLYQPYQHAGTFNYSVSENTWLNLPFRVIRDIVVLPNPGDHELMLCKAYFQLGFKFLNLFYCYFLLGHREPIAFEPPWADER